MMSYVWNSWRIQMLPSSMPLLYLFSSPVLSSAGSLALSSSPSARPLLAACVAVGPRPFPGGSVGKSPPASAGAVGSTPESGRFPGEGNDSPLQCACLGNPTGRGACLRNLAPEPPLPGPQPQLCSGSKPRRICFMTTRKAEPVWELCPQDLWVGCIFEGTSSQGVNLSCLDASSAQKQEEECRKQQEKGSREEKAKGRWRQLSPQRLSEWRGEDWGPPAAPGAGTHGVTERSSGPPPDRRHRCFRLKMRSFGEGVWAVEQPSHQAGRLPQGPWQWYRDPHSLCCYMTTSWRTSRSSRILGENEEKWPSRSAMGPAETSRPLTGDSRLPHLPSQLASQAQK